MGRIKARWRDKVRKRGGKRENYEVNKGETSNQNNTLKYFLIESKRVTMIHFLKS
jgi:hypothetical protein